MNKKFAIIAGLAVLICIGGIIAWKYNKPKTTDKPTVLTLKKQDLTSSVSVTGSLKPRIEISLTSAKKGQVEEILVNEGDYVKKGQTLASISSEDRINLLNTATKNLERAQKSGDTDDIDTAKEQLRIAEIAYQKVPLVSPIDGLVTLRNVEPGQQVETTTTILQISDELVVNVLVDETDIGKIAEGMKAEISVDAYPDENITGKIIKIAYTATTESNVTSYEVLVQIDSGKSKLLKSGMTADVNIIVAEKKNIIVLAADAIRTMGTKKMVLTLGDDDKPSPREVTTGIEDEDAGTEIVSGLKEGDRVVIISTQSSSTSSSGTKDSKRNMDGPPMMMGGGPR